jgi:hypothetical protein
MDAFLAMKVTHHRSIQSFKTCTNEVQLWAGAERAIGYVIG